MNAVVLAGGAADDVARLQNAPNKAFVQIGGTTLAERTMRPLRQSARIERIVVVAPQGLHGHPALALADEFRGDGAKIRDSLRSGLEGFAPDELLLVAASDLPVLNVAAVDDFLQRSASVDPDLGYGVVERGTSDARFPGVTHTWAKLRDGTYCGSGLIAIKPRIFPQLERFIERLGRARKNPLRLASIFGWDVLLRFAARRLTVEAAERRASEILKARVRAIVSPFPETAVNVDRPSDVALAESLIRRSPAPK